MECCGEEVYKAGVVYKDFSIEFRSLTGKRSFFEFASVVLLRFFSCKFADIAIGLLMFGEYCDSYAF